MFVRFIRSDVFIMPLSNAGKGSYGAVYKARDLKTSELVAIKVISLSEGVCFIVLTRLNFYLFLLFHGKFL